MPRVRFTVRLLMLVVLAVAVLLGAFEAGRRWERAGRKSAPGYAGGYWHAMGYMPMISQSPASHARP